MGVPKSCIPNSCTRLESGTSKAFFSSTNKGTALSTADMGNMQSQVRKYRTCNSTENRAARKTGGARERSKAALFLIHLTICEKYFCAPVPQNNSEADANHLSRGNNSRFSETRSGVVFTTECSTENEIQFKYLESHCSLHETVLALKSCSLETRYSWDSSHAYFGWVAGSPCFLTTESQMQLFPQGKTQMLTFEVTLLFATR